ncbi:hypothetical protein ACFQL4_09870 [Halosimplex aquaticum]
MAHAAAGAGAARVRLVGVFAVGRWLDDAASGLAGVFIVGYPGFFLYLLLTSCQTAQRGFLGLSDPGRPSTEGGGLMGGQTTVAPPPSRRSSCSCSSSGRSSPSPRWC